MFLNVTGMVPAMSTGQLGKIAVAVIDARNERGWTKEEAGRKAGISSITWKRVEDGEKVRETTYRAMESAFGWTVGSVDRVGQGAEPILTGRPLTPAASDSSGMPLGKPGDPVEGYLAYFSTVELINEVEARVVRMEQSIRRARALKTGQDTSGQGGPGLITHPGRDYVTGQPLASVSDEVTERRFWERAAREEHPVAARTAPSEDIEEHTRSLERGEESQDPGGDEPS
jgi:DNA-binding XRE family transcriptional regulator